MIGSAASRLAAGRLLERAQGHVAALRPSLPPTFAAEQGHGEAPVRFAETSSAPGETAVEPLAGPAGAGPVAPRRLVPFAKAQDPVAGRASTARLALVPQEAPEAGLIPPTEQASREPPGLRAAAAAPSTGPVGPATLERPAIMEPRLVPGSHPAASPQDRSGLAAALRSLLDPSPSAAATPVAPIAAAEAGTSATEADSPAQPATQSAASGVTVHIGEIVIAPEPRGRPPESAPRPAWQPPVSLADYRASRARNWQ